MDDGISQPNHRGLLQGAMGDERANMQLAGVRVHLQLSQSHDVFQGDQVIRGYFPGFDLDHYICAAGHVHGPIAVGLTH